MSTNVTVPADQWWSDIPRPRRLLALFCLLVSKEDHPAFHWNGETGDVQVLNPDGTRNYEMVAPPLPEFHAVLKDLEEHWSLYEEREIEFEVPLKSSTQQARIRLEQRKLFPHLCVDIVNCGDDAEREEALKIRFNGHLPFDDSKNKRITIRGRVLDHTGNPVPNVRLADRKSNWTESMMDEVKRGDLASQVVFSNDDGEYELVVELTPGIPDLDEVVVVYKPPSIDQWLRAEFSPDDIAANPNDVTLQLPNPGGLAVAWDFSESNVADSDHLQIGVFKDRFYRVSDIETKGELQLTGLVPGKYQVGIGTTDSREHVAFQTVEVVGGETAERHLERIGKLQKKLHMKLSGVPMRTGDESGDVEFMLGVYPTVQSPWGQRGLEWCRNLSGLQLDQDGVYQTTFDATMLWNGNVRIWFYRNARTDGLGEWKETVSTSIHDQHDSSANGDPCLSWDFEDGTRLELRVEESSEVASPENSSESSDELTDWWNQQTIQQRIFNRLLISAIRQGLNLAYWEQGAGTFTAYRKDDNRIALLHRIGHTKFNVVFRELCKNGLSMNQPIVLQIPVGKNSIAVEVSMMDQQHDAAPLMKISWKTVTDSGELAALKRLVGSFPQDWSYKTIRGRVLDHQGKPVAGAVVFDSDENRSYTFTSPEGREPLSGTGPRTDQEGNFELQVIQSDEDWRNEEQGIALAVQAEQLKGGFLKLDGPLGSADIDGVEIRLAAPAELVVNFDMAGVDDIVAPLQLHIETCDGSYWETVSVTSSGEMRFPKLAPGIWSVSLHQLGNDLARQVVELSSSAPKTVCFTSAEKIELHCEITFSAKPNKHESIDFRFEAKNRSPFESFRQDDDANFDWIENVEIEPDQFEECDGQWKFAFPIRNLIGGLYELEVSVSRSEKEHENAWSEYVSRSKSREIAIADDPIEFEPTDFEWKLDEGQTIRLTVVAHR